MRSHTERAEILALVGEGHNDCEIARRTDVPRTTVRDIRRPRRRYTGEFCPRWTSLFLDHGVADVSAQGGSMRVLCVYSSHLPCLFPQHGAGKKHERPIVLEP